MGTARTGLNTSGTPKVNGSAMPKMDGIMPILPTDVYKRQAVDSVGGMMAIQFLINFLWFFGIYGSAVPDSVTAGFFMTNITANAAAYAAGEPLPAIATAPFLSLIHILQDSGSIL